MKLNFYWVSYISAAGCCWFHISGVRISSSNITLSVFTIVLNRFLSSKRILKIAEQYNIQLQQFFVVLFLSGPWTTPCVYIVEELLEFLEPNFISLVLPAISCQDEFCNWVFYLRMSWHFSRFLANMWLVLNFPFKLMQTYEINCICELTSWMHFSWPPVINGSEAYCQELCISVTDIQSDQLLHSLLTKCI